MLCVLSGRPSFQTVERQSQLPGVAGSIRFSTRSSQQLLPKRRHTPQAARWLGCVAPTSFLATKLQCVVPESVRALASVQDLRPARERKRIGALDLSRDT